MDKFTCNYMSKISVTMHLLKMNEYKINELGIQCIVQGFSFQFCDIENLPNFSKKKLAKLLKSTLGKRKPPNFSPFFCWKKTTKDCQNKTHWCCAIFLYNVIMQPFLCWSLEPHIITSSSLVCQLKFNINVINFILFFGGHASLALVGTQDCE